MFLLLKLGEALRLWWRLHYVTSEDHMVSAWFSWDTTLWSPEPWCKHLTSHRLPYCEGKLDYPLWRDQRGPETIEREKDVQSTHNWSDCLF